MLENYLDTEQFGMLLDLFIMFMSQEIWLHVSSRNWIQVQAMLEGLEDCKGENICPQAQIIVGMWMVSKDFTKKLYFL